MTHSGHEERTLGQLRQRYGTRRVARYMLEAFAAHVIYGVFRVLPLQAASWLGGKLMRLLGPRFSRTRKTVLPQLAMSFPEKSAAERNDIMRDVWENIGRVFAEYAHLHHIHDRVEVVGAGHLDAAKTSARPRLFVTAHLANWELAANIIERSGVPLHIVYRAPNNPWVAKLLERARAAGSGGRLIPKGAAGARQILSVMRNKGAVGLLVDQRMTDGAPVNFFGRPALTAPAVALFAQKYAAEVHYVHVERLQGARFRVTISPEVPVLGDRNAFLQSINDELERWVRKRPGQWLWTHRRWSA